MVNTLLGIKKGMTSSYDSRGRRVGATMVFVGPNYITQIKTSDKDGYDALQLGFETKKSVRKPQIGHVKKAGLEKQVRFFKEVKVAEGVTLGQEIKLKDVFAVGDSIKVTGISKGRGFQGGVKRYNFRGGPKTHGQSDRHRAPGSIGSGTTPGRVLKGKRMAGHMGVDQVSYKGLEVLAVDKTNDLITVKGGIPGPVGGLVILSKIGRIKGYTPPPEEKPSDDESMEGKEDEGENKTEQAKEPTVAEGSGEVKGEKDNVS
ncbi:50S ribosomal protein L3 [Candidatus Daviesbacteria bacterium]|nr:50S ribosomal protein L3 [Candidatus Daviesbacteria bacterium]